MMYIKKIDINCLFKNESLKLNGIIYQVTEKLKVFESSKDLIMTEKRISDGIQDDDDVLLTEQRSGRAKSKYVDSARMASGANARSCYYVRNVMPVITRCWN